MQCKHSTSEKAKLPRYSRVSNGKIKGIRYNCDMESGSLFSTATSIPNNCVCSCIVCGGPGYMSEFRVPSELRKKLRENIIMVSFHNQIWDTFLRSLTMSSCCQQKCMGAS